MLKEDALKLAKELYKQHQQRFKYEVPESEEKDLYILTNCMSEEYINNWIEAIQKYPPATYPLDMFYAPSINRWVSLYLYFGDGSKELGFCVSFVKDEEALLEINKLNEIRDESN